MKVRAGAYTGKGIRPRNEDAFLCALQQGGGIQDSGTESGGAEFSGIVDAPLFFLVADGMGGHDAGAEASSFVTDKMRHAAQTAACGMRFFDESVFEALIKSIHAAILKEGIKQGTPNMGSTLTGILLQKNSPCAFFNVGDSRVYRLRGGFIQQLSRDDSLSSIMPEAVKNIITNAIGAGMPDIQVASRFSPTLAVAGDLFLMCSDGVHGFVSDDDLEKMLVEKLPLREIAKQIVDFAIANNSDDNCTAMAVKIEE